MQDNFVLMVDDDSVFTDIIGNHFSHEGIRCVYAPSGAIALDMLSKDPLPCAILLDIRMPEMDGFEVLEKVKQDPRTASIPVVVFSNNTASESRDRAMQLGAVDFIQKVSVVPGDVVEKIRSCMSPSTPQTELKQ